MYGNKKSYADITKSRAWRSRVVKVRAARKLVGPRLRGLVSGDQEGETVISRRKKNPIQGSEYRVVRIALPRSLRSKRTISHFTD